MENSILFLSSILISYSGFTIGFYNILALNQIEKITKRELSRGIDFESDENISYYSKQYEKWKRGAYFRKPQAVTIGIFISIIGSSLNLIRNEWWTILVSLLVSYIIYLQLTKTIKWISQLTSVIALLTGLILLIFI